MDLDYVKYFLKFYYSDYNCEIRFTPWKTELLIDRVQDYRHLETKADVSWMNNLDSYTKAEVDNRLHLLMTEIVRKFDTEQNSAK